MRVSVASLTGNHPLDLARELNRAGVLDTYHCALPRFRVTALPRERLRTHPILFLPMAAFLRAGFMPPRHLIWATIEAYDRALRRALGPCEVFHVGSGYGLRAIRRARSDYGALTVCDRGSQHIRTQDEILREEAERCGVRRFQSVDPRVVVKEEAEYEEADCIFVPSTFARDSFLRAGVNPGKVITVPFGVRLEAFFPTGKRDDVFRILSVARLSLGKGIRYLLEATSRLALPNSEVVLRGPATPESQRILAPYKRRFRLHPPVSRHTDALRNLYSQASVFVLASIDEGLAYVMCEAMACGVPVIATTNTGAAEVITDGKDGFIVPIRNPDAIAERLQYLYDHPEERAAMGRAALEKVRSLGGWRQYAERVVSVYREKLRARGDVPILRG